MKQPYNTTIYNTALYLRLSRDDELQGESGSIQTQRMMLRQYAAEHGLTVVDEYIDATVIIGLKQNPTHGRRFSPVFLLKSGILWGKTQNATTKRRKTEYGMG